MAGLAGIGDAGILVASNPASSFFYVLTAAHAFHVLGGSLGADLCGRAGVASAPGPAKRTVIDVSAIFWHFLDGLWVFLMLLFYVWA